MGGYTGLAKRKRNIERYNPFLKTWELLNFKLHLGIEGGFCVPNYKNNN